MLMCMWMIKCMIMCMRMRTYTTTPSGDKEVGMGGGGGEGEGRHPTRHPTGHAVGNRRTAVKRNVCLDFALATEGSFLSPAHAASPRCPLARNDTKRFPSQGTPFHFDLTPRCLCL